MADTDRELDELIVEIQAENERLIREYLAYVMRARDAENLRGQGAAPAAGPPTATPTAQT